MYYMYNFYRAPIGQKTCTPVPMAAEKPFLLRFLRAARVFGPLPCPVFVILRPTHGGNYDGNATVWLRTGSCGQGHVFAAGQRGPARPISASWPM